VKKPKNRLLNLLDPEDEGSTTFRRSGIADIGPTTHRDTPEDFHLELLHELL